MLAIPPTPRELDSRIVGGLDVRLLWDPAEDRSAVAVEDVGTGGRFTIDVREDEHPLEVFRHPYAYAAWHGIDTQSATA
jgi:hypothetical protein